MKRIIIGLLLTAPVWAQTYPRGPFGVSTDRVIDGSEVQEFRLAFRSSLNILGTERTGDLFLKYLLGGTIPSASPLTQITVPQAAWNVTFRLDGASILRDLYRQLAIESHNRLREMGDTPYAINNLVQDATVLITDTNKRRRVLTRLKGLREKPDSLE